MLRKSDYPKISVITPSFNQGQYIEQTIRSVVEQGYPNIEYSIFDGGSTDQSVEIIKKYAKKYPFIYWESKKDKGQVDAINKGLKRATGEIVAYLNSDDYYLPGAFEAISAYFQSHPDCLWVVGNCQVTELKLKWTFWLKSIWPIDKVKWALQIFNTVNQPAVFLRKELVNKVGLFDSQYKYAFDYDYWLRCLKTALPHKIKQFVTAFRVHDSSLGNLGFNQQFEEDWIVAGNYTRNVIMLLMHYWGKILTQVIYRHLK